MSRRVVCSRSNGARAWRRMVVAGGRGRALASLAIVLFATGGAAAQDADLRLFAPAPGPHGILAARTTRTLDHLQHDHGLFFDYARDLLVGKDGQGATVRPLAHRVSAEAGVTVGIFGTLDLSVALPFHVWQGARGYPQPWDHRDTSGLGDLRLEAKVPLLRNGQGRGFGVALVADLTAPTGRRDHLMGNRGVVFTPTVVADYRDDHGVVSLNVGYRVRSPVRIGDLVVNDELVLRLGAEVPLKVWDLSVLAEVDATLGRGGLMAGAEGLEERYAPVEALGAVRWRAPSGLVITAGVGSGLTSGDGAPDVRAFLGIGLLAGGWKSQAAGPETVRPGALVPAAPPASGAPAGTAAPIAPGSPPASAAPGVPAPGPQVPEPAPGPADPWEAPDPDRDGDGLPDRLDRCPDEREDPDGFQDDDGCPDPDNDQDGIPDGQDRCRDAPETINGIDDDDGCPDEGASNVVVTGERVEINQRIYFLTGSDALEERSLPILREVAATLKAHWNIRVLRVEGHTDDRGDPEVNVDLSERRAARVAAYLVEQGVKPWRLSSKGYGSRQPLGPNDTEENRARNRRVEFRILEGFQPGGGR